MESFSIQYSNYTSSNYLYAAAYYPFGMNMPGATHNYGSGYRWGYQGQYAERDSETGLSAFMLRQYDGRIGRWTTIDPYGQYWSPYLGMGNNPVMFVDSDGRWAHLIAKHGLPAIAGLIKGGANEFAGQVILNVLSGKKPLDDIKTSLIMISAGQGFFKELAGSIKGGSLLEMAAGISELGADIYGSFSKGIDEARRFSLKKDNYGKDLEAAAIALSYAVVDFTFNNLLNNNLKLDNSINMNAIQKKLQNSMLTFLMNLNSSITNQILNSVINRNLNQSNNPILQNKYTKP
jgi:RHS repeat-associated protein